MFIPKISVVMSVFNDEKFIVESIESVLNQTFKDFEFIIINDCSTDKTLEIIKFYKAKDDRIVLIDNKNNLGLTKNLNKGLKISKGKYIARIDGDDLFFPKKLEIQYDYLEKNNDIFLISTFAEFINEKGNFIHKHKKNYNFKKISEKLEKGNFLIHSSIFFRNEQYFYREKFIYAQDYDFYLMLLTKNKKINTIPQILIKYRINKQAISWTKNSKQRLFAEKIKEFYFQRKKTGIDDYYNFNPNEILNLDVKNSSNKIVLKGQIISNFELNNFQKSRFFCQKYFKHYGFFNKFIFYYLLSFTNQKIVNLIRKIIKPFL